MVPKKFFLVCNFLLAISGICAYWNGIQENSNCCNSENYIRICLYILGFAQFCLSIVNFLLADSLFLQSLKDKGLTMEVFTIILGVLTNIVTFIKAGTVLLDKNYDSCKQNCSNLITIYLIVMAYELFFGLIILILPFYSNGKKKKLK